MSVGIVSLWYGHEELLPNWDKLLSVSGWDEFILIDNGSPDGERLAWWAKSAAANGHPIRLYRHPVNDCVRAVNNGLNLLRSDVMVYMSNDVVMTDRQWLAWLVDGLKPGVMRGPSLRNIHGVRYIDGTTIAFHQQDWQRLAGFSDKFLHPGYFGDTDFGWRAGVLGIDLQECRAGTRDLGSYTASKMEQKPILESWDANQALFLERIKRLDLVREGQADLT